MEELTVFEGHEVRFFPTEDGSFEVVAADVAKVLEYGDTSNFANLVSDKYKYTRQNLPGGYIVVLTEPGFYQALSRSNKPKAQPFQDWVYEEALPKIRKTGRYSLQEPSKEDLARWFLEESEKRKLAEAKIAELQQKQEKHYE